MNLSISNAIRVIALSWVVAVSFGALGAHFLKAHLTPDSLESFQVGLRYHFYFNIASLLLILIHSQLGIQRISTVLKLMSIGTLLFSGSIYLLSTSSLTGLSVSFLGPVTPIGGLLLIISWFLLFMNVKSKSTNEMQKKKTNSKY